LTPKRPGQHAVRAVDHQCGQAEPQGAGHVTLDGGQHDEQRQTAPLAV
jgi:hypothetical protein